MASATFNIAADGDDGAVEQTGATYPPSTNTFTTGSVLVSRSKPSGYSVEVGLLKWDTSSLPDGATITAATLRGWCQDKASTDNLSLTADWYNWGAAVDSADWTNTPGTSAHAGTALSAITLGADNDFALVNPAGNVSRTGTTYLRLHISQRASDAAPTGNNYVQLASHEHATLVEARLIVTYNLGGSLVGMVGI